MFSSTPVRAVQTDGMSESSLLVSERTRISPKKFRIVLVHENGHRLDNIVFPNSSALMPVCNIVSACTKKKKKIQMFQKFKDVPLLISYIKKKKKSIPASRASCIVQTFPLPFP